MSRDLAGERWHHTETWEGGSWREERRVIKGRGVWVVSWEDKLDRGRREGADLAFSWQAGSRRGGTQGWSSLLVQLYPDLTLRQELFAFPLGKCHQGRWDSGVVMESFGKQMCTAKVVCYITVLCTEWWPPLGFLPNMPLVFLDLLLPLISHCSQLHSTLSILPSSAPHWSSSIHFSPSSTGNSEQLCHSPRPVSAQVSRPKETRAPFPLV